MSSNSYWAMPRTDEIKLAAGEMTAQELRTAKAVLQWFITRTAGGITERIAELEKRADDAWMAAQMERESAEYWKAQASALANAVLSGDDRPGMLELAKHVSDATGGNS